MEKKDLLNKQIDVHSGFVKLINYMGDDDSICEAARCSTGSSGKDNAGLIDYLVRHRHTSPLEFVEFIFNIKCPIFVMRQLIRHRTANVNETSLRYSEAVDDFFIPSPENVRKQSNKNMQMTDEVVDIGLGDEFSNYVSMQSKEAYDKYSEFLEKGVCREQARIILPVDIYTKFYWKMDLHNLFHFLKLRLDKHAQEEMRVCGCYILFCKRSNTKCL